MSNKFNIPPQSKSLLSSTDKLKSCLESLIGFPFKLSGKPRTDGSKIRKLVSGKLEENGLPTLAEQIDYTIIPPKRKGVPRILTELVDTYLVTTGDSYNLQVWNRIPNSKSILVQYLDKEETICNNEVRYILIKIDNDQIDSIAILSADYIEKKFGSFGRPTIKHQLLISDINRNKILKSESKIKYAPDTQKVTKISTDLFITVDSNIGNAPIPTKLFSLDLILNKVARPLIGFQIEANDTKTRGQSLERKVAELLGYNTEQQLVGGYPDLPNQLLEVKVQDSQTIDLGKYSPEFEEDIYKDLGITTFDIRYLIALTNPNTNIVEGVILMSGKALGEHYTYVSDTSYKCQRSIPMSFFSSIKGKCVVNPECQKPL